ARLSCKTEINATFPDVDFRPSEALYWFRLCPNTKNCESDDECDKHAACVNTTLGPKCICNNGFKGDGYLCKFCGVNCSFEEQNEGSLWVNESLINGCTDEYCSDNEKKCFHTEGGLYRCSCKKGYKVDGNSCVPVCNQGCVHGICTKPDICDCNFGFVGSNCSLKCNCNGHSNCRDAQSLNICIKCHNNTQGDHCQNCRPFFVGNPVNGGKCTPCNVYCTGHSEICLSYEYINATQGIDWERVTTINDLKDRVLEGSNDAVCINCKHNTEGKQCENCIPGYFKSGGLTFEGCIACHCHGHGDMCDPNSGESCNCGNNTENDRQCLGKHSKNSLTPCWQLQCSKCKEYFLGVPTHGHQCYRHMFLDRDYCFDTETQEECNRKPNPLLLKRTVFFAVQPRYMNVDIRIVVDVSQGALDFYLSAKEDTFVVDVDKNTGVHNVWLDSHYSCEYEEDSKDLIILRKNNSFNDSSFATVSTVHQGPPLYIKHYLVNGITTYITVTNPNELLVVRGLENRLVVTIPQEVHDLRSTRFYIILRGTASETFGNLFFRQDQSRIDLFVFFSVFFSCFFLFLASCVVVWKVKQAFDMRRARRLHAAEMKHMASRPFASVLVYLDSRSDSDFEFALSAISNHVHGKKSKPSAFRIKGSHSSLRDSPKYHGPYIDSDRYFVRPVAVETTSEGQAAVVTTLILLPGGSATPVRLTLASTLVSLRGSHQILNQGNNPTIVGEVFRAAMKRRTTNSVI
ncbi:hypothetical protein B4U80_04898, partial [Leptotrombidium deliense]